MSKDMPEISEELTRHLEDLHRWYETDPRGYEAYLQGLGAERVEALMDSPQLAGNSELVIDATGVGPPVTDIFSKRGRAFKAVKIHGGDSETREQGVYRVPKRNLVSALQAALQTGTLKIASSLALAEVLRGELLNFRIKINLQTGHDSYEHWREGDHDDLVLAAAMAVWSAKAPGATMIFV